MPNRSRQKKTPSLFTRLLASYLTVLGLLCAGYSLISFVFIGRTYRAATEKGLLDTARALAASYESLPPENPEAVESWAGRVGRRSGLRITLVGPQGEVVADSSGTPGSMDNHGSRPEIAAALAGEEGMAARVSNTLGMESTYAAVPLRDAGDSIIRGALRVSADLPGLRSRLRPAYAVFGLLALLAAAFSFAAASHLASRIARPLGGALASMASELSDRIAAAEARESELGAILEAMTEALLVLDPSLRIRLANARARELFGLKSPLPSSPGQGPEILQATRSQDLEDLATRAGARGEGVEAEIRFHRDGGERVYIASARPYGEGGAEPRHRGIVLLLADATRTRLLETVRKDFVANVSHELRTPIQIIKGFSENLLEGGLENGEQARRFASIIDRNAARMENLVDDLLSLARLEQGSGTLETSRERILPLLSEAAEILSGKAVEKNQTLLIDCPPELEWDIDPGLFVQALVNLMGNAIQYSGEGEPIRVKAELGASGDLEVSVADRGAGIPAADLPRIFERFYRVDKARSRSKGGTGLGLAIVKHIATAHGGKVKAESWEGEGSVFTLILPAGDRGSTGPNIDSGSRGGD